MKLFFYTFFSTIIFISLIILGSLYVSCSKSQDISFISHENSSITEENNEDVLLFNSFSFLKVFNEELLTKDYIGIINDKTITITIDEVTDLTNLKPTFETNKDCDVYCEGIINESSGDKNNFYKILTYKLKYLENETTYTLKVIYDKTQYFQIKDFKIEKKLNEDIPTPNDIFGKTENNSIIINMPKYYQPNKIKLTFQVLPFFRLWTNYGIEIKSGETLIDLSRTNYIILESPSTEKKSFELKINYILEPDSEYILNKIDKEFSKIVNEGGNFYKINSFDIDYNILSYESIEIDQSGNLLSIDYSNVFYIDYNVKIAGNVIRRHYTEELTPPETPIKRLINIYGVAPEGPSGSYDECIILYNPSDRYVDLKNLKILYQTASGTSAKLKYEIKNLIILRPKGYILIVSDQFNKENWEGDSEPDIISESSWSLSGTGGHIIISNIHDEEIDRLGYGNCLYPEKESIKYSKGKLIYRKNPNIDTDNNNEDFTVSNNIGGYLKNRCTN